MSRMLEMKDTVVRIVVVLHVAEAAYMKKYVILYLKEPIQPSFTLNTKVLDVYWSILGSLVARETGAFLSRQIKKTTHPHRSLNDP